MAFVFFLLSLRGLVSNEGLEKARAYLNQVTRTNGLKFPPKDTRVTVLLNLFVVKVECTLKRKNSCCQWSSVQHFNHLLVPIKKNLPERHCPISDIKV